MSVKNRIKMFVKNEGISVSAFEKSILASNGYVNSIHKSIGIDKLTIILEKYPKINIEWLFTGKGEMLKKHTETNNTVAETSHQHQLDVLSKEVVDLKNTLKGIQIILRANKLMEEVK